MSRRILACGRVHGLGKNGEPGLTEMGVSVDDDAVLDLDTGEALFPAVAPLLNAVGCARDFARMSKPTENIAAWVGLELRQTLEVVLRWLPTERTGQTGIGFRGFPQG